MPRDSLAELLLSDEGLTRPGISTAGPPGLLSGLRLDALPLDAALELQLLHRMLWSFLNASNIPKSLVMAPWVKLSASSVSLSSCSSSSKLYFANLS